MGLSIIGLIVFTPLFEEGVACVPEQLFANGKHGRKLLFAVNA